MDLALVQAESPAFEIGEHRFDPGQDYWITHFFCMFFLGAAVWWTLDGRISERALWLYVALVVVRLGIDVYGSATDTDRNFRWPLADLYDDWWNAICRAVESDSLAERIPSL